METKLKIKKIKLKENETAAIPFQYLFYCFVMFLLGVAHKSNFFFNIPIEAIIDAR